MYFGTPYFLDKKVHNKVVDRLNNAVVRPRIRSRRQAMTDEVHNSVIRELKDNVRVVVGLPAFNYLVDDLTYQLTFE